MADAAQPSQQEAAAAEEEEEEGEIPVSDEELPPPPPPLPPPPRCATPPVQAPAGVGARVTTRGVAERSHRTHRAHLARRTCHSAFPHSPLSPSPDDARIGVITPHRRRCVQRRPPRRGNVARGRGRSTSSTWWGGLLSSLRR
jgi:hypothetical protein